MPRVVKMFEKSKGSLVHNSGPISPITRKEVKANAGSLENVYRKRAAYGSERAMDVVDRIDKVTGTKTKLTR